jgi:hypothetical protein
MTETTPQTEVSKEDPPVLVAPESTPTEAVNGVSDVDPRDAEIERLRALVAKRNEELSARKDAELAALQAQMKEFEAEDPEVYAQLSNGEFVKVRTSELPGYAGTNAVYGFWEKDGHVYHIIGTFPAETEVKE